MLTYLCRHPSHHVPDERGMWRATNVVQRAACCQRSSSHIHTCTALHDAPMLTLERAVGNSFGSDRDLRETGAFAAEVFPDLPVATTWGNLLKAVTRLCHHVLSQSGLVCILFNDWKLLFFVTSVCSLPSRYFTQHKAGDQGQVLTDGQHQIASPGAIKVSTVAVNLRSTNELEHRIQSVTSATRLGAEGNTLQGHGSQQQDQQAAGALLFVSGSHPVRSVPGVNKILPSSIHALQLATKLKAQGGIPADTCFWAVANPNTEPDASLLEAKVANGAQVILTQPPFDKPAFHTWLQDVNRRGIPGSAKILVGMPVISSPANLLFWLNLAACMGRPGALQLLSSFQAAGSRDADGGAAYCLQYNTDLIKELLAMPGVAGLHVMPISPASRRMALEFVKQGVLKGQHAKLA